MTKTELDSVLYKHRRWILGHTDGAKANLCGADLCGADLREANLCGADLCEADLREADLREANLCGADLREADLREANLCGADLCEANLCGADLREADLREADLCGADLCGADLREANLCGADLREADLCEANLCEANLCGADLRGANGVPFIPMTCPDAGAFIGWKKAYALKPVLVKLLIPEEAERCSATGRKCRASKAVVLEIQNLDGSKSDMTAARSSRGGVYRVGETTYPDSFDRDRFNECSPGIHFFINRQEAVDYR